MDGTKDLFRKVKGRDRASFDALSESYGWKLYSYIRKNTEDREVADQIFSDTFNRFYDTVEHYEGDDPIEAMLFVCADKVRAEKSTADKAQGKSREMGQWAIGHEAGFSLPEVKLKETPEKKKEPLLLRIFYGLCIIILVVGIAAALWIMAYMLMSMHVLPSVDLGYSWFNAHIADLF